MSILVSQVEDFFIVDADQSISSNETSLVSNTSNVDLKVPKMNIAQPRLFYF